MSITVHALKTFKWFPSESSNARKAYSFAQGSDYTLPVEVTESESWDALLRNGQLELTGGLINPISSLSTAPDVADGLFRSYAMDGAATLYPPTGNVYSGQRWECWFVGDGSVLTLDPAILVPSDSSFAGTKTLDAGRTYILLLKYGGNAWYLVSLVGGYTLLS